MFAKIVRDIIINIIFKSVPETGGVCNRPKNNIGYK